MPLSLHQNNPSESIIAKRRGYGTIISHNVPPYGRAGLYKQLYELRGLLQATSCVLPSPSLSSSPTLHPHGLRLHLLVSRPP